MAWLYTRIASLEVLGIKGSIADNTSKWIPLHFAVKADVSYGNSAVSELRLIERPELPHMIRVANAEEPCPLLAWPY